MWMIIAAAILVGGSFVFAEYARPLPESSAENSFSAVPGTASSTILADGDWQQTLTGTGSGSAGPGQNLDAGTSTAAATPVTETDELGKDLLIQYMSATQNGQDLSDPDTVNSAVSNALADDSIFAKPKKYLLTDLNLSASANPDSFRAYGNAIATLFGTYDGNQGEEIQIAEDGIESGSESTFAEIDPIIANYQAIVAGLLKVPVPRPAADAHIDLINTVSMMLSSAQLLRHSDNDSVAAIQAIVQDRTSLGEFAAAIDEIGYVLEANHADFRAGDPGQSLETYIDPNQGNTASADDTTY